MMHMTFYWGKQVTILIDPWKTYSWTSYVLSLLALFLLSVFYQYMEDRRIGFKLLVSSPTTPRSAATSVPLLYPKLGGGGGRWIGGKVGGAVLFGVNSAMGYLLMLAIMSFNGGVFVAVVVGLGVGYLLFRSGEEERVVVVDNPCACA